MKWFKTFPVWAVIFICLTSMVMGAGIIIFVCNIIPYNIKDMSTPVILILGCIVLYIVYIASLKDWYEFLGKRWVIVDKASIELEDSFPEIVVLCGSTRFKNQFKTIELDLSLKGCIVLSLPCFEKSDNISLTARDKTKLSDLQKQRIRLADRLYIINVHGHIGDDTAEEIEYGERLGKKITYLVNKV
jgi:hypothetical protein